MRTTRAAAPATIAAMGPVATLRLLGGVLAPPRCGACGEPCGVGDAVCDGCHEALLGARPFDAFVPGLGNVRCAAAYEGVARHLVAGLKFGARLPLAPLMARALASALGPQDPEVAVVAVPPAPLRRLRRGFDPAEELARALAVELGLRSVQPLRRASSPRQVGRGRRGRLASPPRVWSVERAPPRVVVVDDVLTTGATMRACVAALRRAGADGVQPAAFAYSVGPGPSEAYHR